MRTYLWSTLSPFFCDCLQIAEQTVRELPHRCCVLRHRYPRNIYAECLCGNLSYSCHVPYMYSTCHLCLLHVYVYAIGTCMCYTYVCTTCTCVGYIHFPYITYTVLPDYPFSVFCCGKSPQHNWQHCHTTEISQDADNAAILCLLPDNLHWASWSAVLQFSNGLTFSSCYCILCNFCGTKFLQMT